MDVIEIVHDAPLSPGFPLGRRELRELLEICLKAMGLDDTVFTLRLVDDAEISRLNAAFLGCTGPTNILSFPAEADEGDADPTLGELALSVPTLTREADLYGQDPQEHTARLLAHGILHLAGYDHGPEMDMLTEVAVAAVVNAAVRAAGNVAESPGA